MIIYTCGFCFDFIDCDRVLLINKTSKNTPDRIKGMLNGIGGKQEVGETPHDCIVREFQEETGLLVKNWGEFATLTIPETCKIHFFANIDPQIINFKQTTDELPELFYARAFTRNYVENGRLNPNLGWLIGMASNFLKGIDKHVYHIVEQS